MEQNTNTATTRKVCYEIKDELVINQDNKFNVYKYYFYIFISLSYFAYYFSSYSYQITNFKVDVANGETIIAYLNGFIAFLFVLGSLGLLTKYLKKLITRLSITSDKNDKRLNDTVLEYILNFISTTRYFLQVYVFFIFIDVHADISFYINKAFYIIFLVIFIYYFTSFFNATFEKILLKNNNFRSLNYSLISFVKKILIIATWIIGIITVLSNLGYNVSAFITGAGIGGLAIALAAQKTLGNVFGAFTVILTRPFKIGDYIRVDSQEGTVREVGLFHMVMTDKAGYKVFIPNEKLTSGNIENFTRRENRRTELFIKIKSSTGFNKVKKAISLIEEILEKYTEDKTVKLFRVGFDGFGSYGLDIRVTYYSLINNSYSDYIKQKENINLDIKKSFEKNKVKIAYQPKFGGDTGSEK